MGLKSKISSMVFFISILVIIVLIFKDYKDYGLTWDEPDQIELGKWAVEYYSGLLHGTFVNSFPSTYFITTRGVFPEVLIQLVRKIVGGDSTDFYHLLVGIFNSISYVFVYMSVFTLTKSRLYGLLSVIGLYLFPRFSGDLFNNSKDTSLGAVISVFIYFSSKYFLSPKRVNRDLFIASLVLGIAVSMRIVSLYIFPIFLILIFIKNGKNLRNFIRSGIYSLVYVLLSLHLFSPYLHSHPVYGIYTMIKESIEYPGVWRTLFDGVRMMSDNLPGYYLTKYIIITSPVYILLTFFLVNAFLLFSGITKKWIYKDRKIFWFSLFLVAMIFIPLILFFFIRPNMYDAWRHFIYLTIPLIIMSFAGLYHIAKAFPGYPKYLALVLIIAAVPVYSEIKYLHPYEYMYFNSIVGGLRNASAYYETDYWGKSFKEASLWINTHPGVIGDLPVFSCVGHLSKPYLDKRIREVPVEPSDPFIYMCITRFGGNEKYGGVVLHSIERHGVAINEVRRIQ